MVNIWLFHPISFLNCFRFFLVFKCLKRFLIPSIKWSIGPGFIQNVVQMGLPVTPVKAYFFQSSSCPLSPYSTSNLAYVHGISNTHVCTNLNNACSSNDSISGRCPGTIPYRPLYSLYYSYTNLAIFSINAKALSSSSLSTVPICNTTIMPAPFLQHA
jgi:hypothetical protein